MTETHHHHPHGHEAEDGNEATEVSRGWLARTKDNVVRWFGHASFTITGETLAAFGASFIPAAPVFGLVTNLAGEAISGQGAKNSSWGEKAFYVLSHIAATAAPFIYAAGYLNPIFIPITGGIAFASAAISMRNRLKN